MKSEARLVDSLKISSLSFGILLSPPTTRAFWCHNLVVVFLASLACASLNNNF